MIVVTVELWSARTKTRKVLGQTIITNQAVNRDGKRGDYYCRVARKGQSTVQAMRKPLRVGHVTNYPRESYNVWRLVLRALRATFPEETKQQKD